MSRERDRVEGIRRMKIREQKKNCLADFRNCHLILLIVVVRPKKKQQKTNKISKLYELFIYEVCVFVVFLCRSDRAKQLY